MLPSLAHQRPYTGGTESVPIRNRTASWWCTRRVSEQVEDRSLFEGQLIESAKKGDHTAYAELVRAHQEIARRLAYLILQRRDDVDDAVQEAFVKAYQAIGRFRSGADFRPWILRIVRNEALNRRRGRVRREGSPSSAANASGDAAPSPEAMVESKDERRPGTQRS